MKVGEIWVSKTNKDNYTSFFADCYRFILLVEKFDDDKWRGVYSYQEDVEPDTCARESEWLKSREYKKGDGLTFNGFTGDQIRQKYVRYK